MHCWKDKGEWIEETYGDLSPEHLNYLAEIDQVGATCMLREGHWGPHVFTPNDEIVVCFSGGKDSQSRP
ncbi:hypothetical protein AMJ85_09890 [candidate division BRC1 bacterium SM23_51]|nr:MAG: hypothetical protein AMJ85_09890 [candidate division BRC1 bacterium SM23_51]